MDFGNIKKVVNRMKHLLLACPNQSELRYFLDGVSQLGCEIQNHSTFKIPVFEVPSKKLIIALGGHGKVQFGVHTQYLLSTFPKAEALLCVGAGGGLANHLKIGDLVIAEKTVEHDYTEKFDITATLPEFSGNSHLLQCVKGAQGLKDFGIYFGLVASGDEDVVDSHRADELYQSTGALAVAWEGSGGARACQFNNVPFLEIRAITDNARDSVPQAFTKNLGMCMSNIAKLIVEITNQ